jgi:diguanylate cyclase (GGDEF)-like protein/PAS domain S-box-containing protein
MKINSSELILEPCNSQIYKRILDEVGTYVFVKDLDRKYMYVNKLTQKLFQKDLEDIIGYDDSHFFQVDALSDIVKNDSRVLDFGETVINEEINVIKSSKEIKVYQSVKKPIYNSNGKIIGLFGVSTDVTETYLLKEKLQSLLLTDDMTKLNNRKSYNENITQLCAQYKRYHTPFSIIMYDIDNFKYINDSYGHKVGDDVLIKMSGLIKPKIRENDHIFRVGGEEFIILLTATEIDRAKLVAEKIRKSVENDLGVIDDKPITISLGLTQIRENDNQDMIFRRVDELLYKSKRNGKNRITSDL